jgi:peroxiredoxin
MNQMSRVPDCTFIFRREGEFVEVSSEDLFAGKRVVLFSLPGAFTPTCSTFQLPGFELDYQKFKDAGIDEIYCVSVNDAFTMNAWAKDQNIQNVKLIPDGNGNFTDGMGMLVEKYNLGFAMRSWRYAAVIDDGFIEWMVEEPGRSDNCEEDPYQETTPEKVLEYVASNVVART